MGESVVGGNNSDETGGNVGQSYVSSSYSIGSWDDTTSIAFSTPSKRGKDSSEELLTGLSHIDSQVLKAAGQLWLLSNMDSQEDIVYPNDPKAVIKVDDDLNELFRSIALPRDMLDIEKDLKKNGYIPATDTAKRRAAAEVHGIIPSNPKKQREITKRRKKQREITKRMKLTNAHMPEHFQNLNFPDS